MGSFRSALALRVAVPALALAAALAVAGSFIMRRHLLATVDAGLLRLAEIEAAVGADPQRASLLFRSEKHLPGEAEAALMASHAAQLRARNGAPLARSRHLDADLPSPVGALAEAAAGGASFETHHWNGERARSVVYPLAAADNAPERLLQVTTSLAPTHQAMNDFLSLMALITLGSGVLGFLVGWAVAGWALRPALALTDEAGRFGLLELGRRVRLPREAAEFRRMADAVNGLLDRAERAVRGTQRFTADASHELRGPLTVLRGELELALTRPRRADEYEEVLRRCLDEVLRLTRLADDLLTLARVEGGAAPIRPVPVGLDEVVEQAIGRKGALASSRAIQVEVSGQAGAVQADQDLLVRALAHLLEHAIMASPRGGRVRVHLANGGVPAVEITDSGPGVQAGQTDGLLDRFYRSERVRGASAESGLGLAIARAVAEAHGGRLEYTGNDPGASFRLALPAG